MNNIKKILLPVDGSENSKRAMEQAKNLSTIMDAEIVLLYVTGMIPNFIIGTPLEDIHEKGIDSLLTKPFSGDEIEETINNVINSKCLKNSAEGTSI